MNVPPKKGPGQTPADIPRLPRRPLYSKPPPKRRALRAGFVLLFLLAAGVAGAYYYFKPEIPLDRLIALFDGSKPQPETQKPLPTEPTPKPEAAPAKVVEKPAQVPIMPETPPETKPPEPVAPAPEKKVEETPKPAPEPPAPVQPEKPAAPPAPENPVPLYDALAAKIDPLPDDAAQLQTLFDEARKAKGLFADLSGSEEKIRTLERWIRAIELKLAAAWVADTVKTVKELAPKMQALPSDKEELGRLRAEVDRAKELCKRAIKVYGEDPKFAARVEMLNNLGRTLDGWDAAIDAKAR